MTKEHYNGIVYAFNGIAERWADYPAFSLEEWHWEAESRIIKLFIKSQVSQKKLFAVKTLGEICRKSTHFNYRIHPEKIKGFIVENAILDDIFRADNHPEVIAKGEEVFLYMAKNEALNHHLINLIFNLIEKCHENLSKSLFSTLQRIE